MTGGDDAIDYQLKEGEQLRICDGSTAISGQR